MDALTVRFTRAGYNGQHQIYIWTIRDTRGHVLAAGDVPQSHDDAEAEANRVLLLLGGNQQLPGMPAATTDTTAMQGRLI